MLHERTYQTFYRLHCSPTSFTVSSRTKYFIRLTVGRNSPSLTGDTIQAHKEIYQMGILDAQEGWQSGEAKDTCVGKSRAARVGVGGNENALPNSLQACSKRKHISNILPVQKFEHLLRDLLHCSAKFPTRYFSMEEYAAELPSLCAARKAVVASVPAS